MPSAGFQLAGSGLAACYRRANFVDIIENSGWPE
jgi:hypothetical protein